MPNAPVEDRVRIAAAPRLEVHRIPELDGIRGIAVLIVVMLHFHAPFAAANFLGPLSYLIGRGWAGVDIFFVLSGYLITSILMATREARNYFSAFYARRALRIVPLYAVALALFFGLLLPLEHRHGLSLGFHQSEQIWYWTFLDNWRQGMGFNDGAGVAHFWSLAIEEQFYVLFSVLVLWLSSRGLVRTCAGMVALSILLRIGLALTGHLPAMALRLTVLHLDPIAIGALLAASARVRAAASRWWIPLVVVGVGGVLLPLPAGFAITAAGLGAAGLVARSTSHPMAPLRAGALRSLGKYSYAMYVIHDFLAGGVAHLARTRQSLGFMLLCLAGGTVASYVLAWLSWNLLEKWFLRLKDRFPYRSPRAEPEVDRHLIAV